MNKCRENLKKLIPILLVLALFLIPIASAITYPVVTGYLTDNANIITPEYKEKITQLAEQINKNTTVEIAVLTIESLEGDSPENYAINVFRNSGVGKKDKNNGLLILVSKSDRKYRFEVGYGLEGTIPDSMKVPIGEKIIVPNFKQGEYGKGIYESMIFINALLTNNTEVISKYTSGGSSGSADLPVWVIILIIIIVVIVIIFILVAIDGGGGSGGYSGGGGGWGGSSGGSDSGGSDSGFGGGSSGGGGFGGGW